MARLGTDAAVDLARIRSELAASAEPAERAAALPPTGDADFERRTAANFGRLHRLFVGAVRRARGCARRPGRRGRRRRGILGGPTRRPACARRRAASATPTGSSRTGCSAASATSTGTPATSTASASTHPLLQRARPHLPAPHAAVPGARRATPTAATPSPATGRSNPHARHDGRAARAGRRAARERHQPRASTSSSTTPRTSTSGRARRSPATRSYRGLLLDLPRPHHARRLRAAPCARSSPTTTRGRSCSCRTAGGSGRRSTASSGT